jgi:hypothetical protein
MDGESRFSAIFGQLRTLSDPLIILLISRSLVRTQQGSPYLSFNEYVDAAIIRGFPRQVSLLIFSRGTKSFSLGL